MDTESDFPESGVSLLHESWEKTSDITDSDRFSRPFSSIYRRGIWFTLTLLSLAVNIGLVLLLLTRDPSNCRGQDVSKYGLCLSFRTIQTVTNDK
jgi:hypothetical protein